MNLLKLSLTISIIGIFFLLLISNLLQPTQIKNYQQLTKLKPNSLVSTTGKIISTYSTNDFHIIKLDNNITLTFNQNKLQLKQNQTITATGIITTYNKQFQIQANKIKVSL